MCGICGVSGQYHQTNLDMAVRASHHRGPDSNGVYYDPKVKIALGHSRLSILDLSNLGRQPMISYDGSVVLVFNGEVYNFDLLRTQLKEKGYIFKGNSDTEVVLNMYLEYGINCLKEFNGIFGLAIYDFRSNDLFVARDAMGVKPVYYFSNDESFAFSSEIKSLLHLIPDELELDHRSLQRYLTFLWCPGEGTPAKSIRKLLPGEFLHVRNSQIIDKVKWYHLPQEKFLKKILSVDEAVIAVRNCLGRAVKDQMVSDVPVGAFLSGGLDSSAIVALGSKIVPRLNCFTIDPGSGSNEGIMSDLPYAKQVAKHLGVNLEILKVDSQNLANDFLEMIWHLDEPLSDPAPLNVLYISRLARKRGIKVLLSGVGGDDIFTGYRRHLAVRYDHILGWLPSSLRKNLGRFTLKLDQSKTFGRRMGRMFNGADLSGNERLAAFFEWTRRDDLTLLLSDDMLNFVKSSIPNKPLLDVLKSADSRISSIDRMLILEQKFFLGDHNLIYSDKMSMAAGVELRVPFLDQEVVELAARIPDHFKQKGRVGKWILKKAMEPYLPRNVIYRPKTGFGAPLRRWIKSDLRELVGDILSKKNIENRGLFDVKSVTRLIADNDAGRRDAAYTIFSLMCVEVWCQKFMDTSF